VPAPTSRCQAFAQAGNYKFQVVVTNSKVAPLECQDARNGVRVNVVTPGGVKTPMWQGMDFFRDLVAQHGGTEEAFAAMTGAFPSQQFFSAEEVARTVLYLASDESSHLSGVELVMDRGNTG
jgi:NAD(P)-dependent dehydrogenase (short-subunit alcohol dehydrogenase family)